MGINRITQLRKNLPVIRPNTEQVIQPRAAPTNFVPQTTVMHYESTYYPKIEAKNLVIHGTSTFKDNVNLQENLTVDGNTQLNGGANIEGNVNVNGAVDCTNLLVNSMVLVPTGTVVSFIKSTAPAGWLICDGTAYSRSHFSKLFFVIGTTFGGDVSTFNVPDLRGRTIIGIGSGVGLTTRNLGDTGGEETHTLTLSEIPAHSHTGNTSVVASHTHSGTSDSVSNHTHTGTTNSAGSHSHTYNDAYFAETGGNQIGGNSVFGTNADTDGDNEFRWRTSSGSYSTSPADLNTSTASAHTHTFTTDAGGSHTHTFTTGSAGSHSHTITSEGGNGTHNNMQPFITLSYIIKY